MAVKKLVTAVVSHVKGKPSATPAGIAGFSLNEVRVVSPVA